MRDAPPLPLRGAPDPFVIAPSILASDFANLGAEVDAVIEAGADWLHVDVMDGAFVPNISIGVPVVRALRNHTDAVLDVHLMVDEPIRYVQAFADAGADIITVHAEATTHLHRTLEAVRLTGAKVGLSLNPATPPEAAAYVLDLVDMILVMSVNPGFGGQSFIPSSLQKIARLRAMIDAAGADVTIEVDGGVKTSNIADAANAGVRAFVAGSAIFKSGDYRDAIDTMKARIRSAIA